MARTIKVFPMANMPDQLFQSIHDYLISEGYEYLTFKGEDVFKKGKGLATAPSLIKVSYQNGGVQLEAWQKYAFLPGVYGGEISLESIVGVAVKGPLKARYANIERMIEAYSGAPGVPLSSQGAPAAPQQQATSFCPHCGAPVQPGSKFCEKCGQPV